MGCSTSFAKLVLFVFNIAFFLFGVASLAVGIWVAVSKNQLFEFINLLDGKISDGSKREDIDAIANQNGMIVVAAYVLIGVGAFTLIVGFCGCCGAMKESPVMLNIFAALVGIVLALEVLVAILAGVFQSKIKDSTEKGMLKLQDKYFVAVPQYEKDNKTSAAAVTYLINFVQVSVGCCGAKEVNDIANSQSWKASDRMLNGKTMETPATCCRLKSDQDKSKILDPKFSWKDIVTHLEDPNCPFTKNSSSINTQKCSDGVVNEIGKFAVPVIGICVAIALLEVLGIVFACCLVNALRNS